VFNLYITAKKDLLFRESKSQPHDKASPLMGAAAPDRPLSAEDTYPHHAQ